MTMDGKGESKPIYGTTAPADRPPSSKRERAKRESELLDEALEETFPASDPVSVARVK